MGRRRPLAIKPVVKVGDPVSAIPTPALVTDLDALQANLAELATQARTRGVQFRPHVKTHKTPEIAHLQMESGAIGLCAAKLGEAEALVEAGLHKVLITTPVVGSAKLARLRELAGRAEITVVVDCQEQVAALRAAGVSVDVLVDLDVGQRRTGCEPEEAVAVARQIAGTPGLSLRGIQAYDGHSQHLTGFARRQESHRAAMRVLQAVVGEFRAAGLPLEVVSTGGTGTISLADTAAGVTEIQPGSYVFMDHEYQAVIDENPTDHRLGFMPSLFCLCTVVSSKGPERVIVDAGTKALTTDYGPARMWNPSGTYSPMGEEHGKVLPGDAGPLPVGARVQIIPSHCCTTVNLYDWLYAVRGDKVAGVWRVTARGAAD